MKRRGVLLLLVLVAVVAATVAVFLNRVYLRDLISALSYEEPTEVLKIKENLDLTDGGDLILRASHTMLESEQDFNRNCKSYSVEMAVTGCYDGSYIHVYEINYEDLDGIMESTMAHELLHAVWNRLDDSEKDRIGEMLLAVYKDARYAEKLENDLAFYGTWELLDELHSRVGTELKDLPEELEEHYAKYFKNQDKVVGFYEKYGAEFRRLKAERETIETKLTELNGRIEEMVWQYQNNSESLVKRITIFNECASKAGCFKTDSEFNSQRTQLLDEQSELNDIRDNLVELIEQYNVLVEKYNRNILRDQELFNMMNSNIEKSDLIK